MNEIYSPEDINWSKWFLMEHPGPSDPRQFEMLKDDWILAKKIEKWSRENEQRNAVI